MVIIIIKDRWQFFYESEGLRITQSLTDIINVLSERDVTLLITATIIVLAQPRLSNQFLINGINLHTDMHLPLFRILKDGVEA